MQTTNPEARIEEFTNLTEVTENGVAVCSFDDIRTSLAVLAVNQQTQEVVELPLELMRTEQGNTLRISRSSFPIGSFEYRVLVCQTSGIGWTAARVGEEPLIIHETASGLYSELAASAKDEHPHEELVLQAALKLGFNPRSTTQLDGQYFITSAGQTLRRPLVPNASNEVMTIRVMTEHRGQTRGLGFGEVIPSQGVVDTIGGGLKTSACFVLSYE